MFDHQGLPPYPPARNAWSFPPAPVGRGWKWAAIAAAVLSIIAASALGTAAVVLGSRDSPGFIQDGDLLTVIGRECELMTSTVESMPVRGDIQDQLATITDQNKAVEHMLKEIRRVGANAVDADRPTSQWLRDWERLVRARKTYADDARSNSSADFLIPRDDDGDEIYRRMDAAVFDGSCEVPITLLTPYPSERTDQI